MASDLSAYRANEREKARVADLFDLIPQEGATALDVGARDGYLSKLLAERFEHVVALDLETPKIAHPRVESVAGNVMALAFEDNTFDTVVCAEVLEHIRTPSLARACREIARVARLAVIVGVPYRQDIRCARTTCRACGRTNPPWGHINTFDESRIEQLFPGLSVARFSYVGINDEWTNNVSTALLDFAGNPYGTYEQDESCVHCGKHLEGPRKRGIPQILATRLAYGLNYLQRPFNKQRPSWIHVRFDKAAP